MSGDTVFYFDGAEKTTDLASVLTSSSPEYRLAGRLMATGVAEMAAKWAEAEIDRGTDVNMLLRVLFVTQIQTAASIGGCLTQPRSFPDLAGNYRDIIDRTFVEHCQRTQAVQRGRRK